MTFVPRGGPRGLTCDRLTDMAGSIIIVVVLLLVLPVTFLVTGGIFSVVLGHFLRKEGEYMNEGSELIELNT